MNFSAGRTINRVIVSKIWKKKKNQKKIQKKSENNFHFYHISHTHENSAKKSIVNNYEKYRIQKNSVTLGGGWWKSREVKGKTKKKKKSRKRNRRVPKIGKNLARCKTNTGDGRETFRVNLFFFSFFLCTFGFF